MKTSAKIALGVVAALPLSGCGEEDSMRLRSDTVPVLTTPPASKRLTTSLPPTTPDYRGWIVQQRSGPLPPGLIPTSWRASGVTPKATAFGIEWTRDLCTREVDRTVIFVDEQPSQVIVDVWQDERPATDEGACVASATLKSTAVRLRAPLGDRALRGHVVPLGSDGFPGP